MVWRWYENQIQFTKANRDSKTPSKVVTLWSVISYLIPVCDLNSLLLTREEDSGWDPCVVPAHRRSTRTVRIPFIPPRCNSLSLSPVFAFSSAQYADLDVIPEVFALTVYDFIATYLSRELKQGFSDFSFYIKKKKTKGKIMFLQICVHVGGASGSASKSTQIQINSVFSPVRYVHVGRS